ncbi:MAG: hypothetical protein P8016_14555 [Sedimentisphaerales bacterium]
MERIAVDIVLLPTQKVMDEAIRTNRELLKQEPGGIVLDRKNCLPHVSLAMGCIDKNAISDTEKFLIEMAVKYPLTLLSFGGLFCETSSAGEKVTVALIEKTKILQSLHEEVMMGMRRFFTYDVKPYMLLSEEPVSESTLLWIQNYAEKSSFESFSPHITLGYGELGNYYFSRQIPISQLALCHLGNHCTCRRILASVLIGTKTHK